MRSVTKKVGVKPMSNAGLAKKRGRPPKAKVSTVNQMKANEDPDIRFIRDLTVTDRTEILEGADPNFRYRWVEESKIGLRTSQGYTPADDEGIRTHHDSNYWQPEGSDTRFKNKGGLKLMKMPVSLAKKRDAIKAEKVERNSADMESSLTSSITRNGGELMSDAAVSRAIEGE